MEAASSELVDDLTLDTIDTPPHSGARKMSTNSPPASPESMLSLDDLSQRSQDDAGSGVDEEEHKESSGGSELLQRHPKRVNPDREAKRMETKLQRNLKQQQEHYIRQRKLFENLRAERANVRSECSPISENSDVSQLSSPDCDVECLATQRKAFPTKHIRAKAFRLQTQDMTSINQLPCSYPRGETTRYQCSPVDDDSEEGNGNAQDMLRRIKEKARAEFHRQRFSSGSNAIVAPTAEGSRALKAPTHFLEELQQQEVSNDALRRQLELLRRLQVENNRFRQETRALRERNEALRDRDQAREREVKSLRDEISDLDARAQRDKTNLAAASQTTQKLKATQKKLTVVQAEMRDLKAALHEARDAHDQLQLESQAEVSELMTELKRWKRSSKQLRLQENRTGEEVEFYKQTIAALEDETIKHRAQLKDAEREIAELSALVTEKTTHCEALETSAADCVERMEASIEELETSRAQECEKRKQAESECSNQRMQLDRQQAENAMLLDKQSELQQQLALFKDHWKERKQAHQEQLRRYASQVEEYIARHKNDAATIGSMREEYDTLETRLSEMGAATSAFKGEVADEVRAVQRQLERLRKYVENAIHTQPGSGGDDDASVVEIEEGPEKVKRSHRDEIWREVPELQVVNGAMSALRNDMMDLIHEFQRSRHLVRQQGNKLALSLERSAELEHLRAEDATKMNDLREQRKLAEQAREIVSQEKEEVLKWSDQMCAKNEALEAEMKKCGQIALQLRKQLGQALESDSDSISKSEATKLESLRASLSAMEGDIDALVSERNHWREESKSQATEVTEIQTQLESVEKAQADKSDEFKQTLKEVERVHAKNVQEQKLHFEQCITDLDNERSTLVNKLEEKATQLAEAEENNANLQHEIDGFEQDLPVFATILHLFVLVVQPLILQVSELLSQKRLLLRENADFAQAHEQIECIGQVLKEMIPGGAANPEKAKEKQRRRLFRRVVITVFAMNRFQHFGHFSGGASEQSSYGLCAPLKHVKSRRRAHTLSLPLTVIKVLPPQATLSRLALRPLLERLKKLEITERVAEVIESCASPTGLMPSSLGSLILKVAVAIDPASKEVLVANTNGVFHCEALLERRRRQSKRRGDQDIMAEYDNPPASEENMPTVALIRKRILALGKRVEDLHYQRNSLQKENYEFQFQLEQQAQSLSEMKDLQEKTKSLQDEMSALRCQTDQALRRTQEEHQAKHAEIQEKEDALASAQTKIDTLEAEISSLHNEITRTESDRLTLQLEIDKLKHLSVEEEVKADKSKAAARRQEEEVKSLKQAVKKAHELYQKVSCQLEQEVQEKSTLQTVVDHLRRQHEKAERELREEKLKDLEKNFKDEEVGQEVSFRVRGTMQERSTSETKHACRRTASPLSRQRKRASFVAPLDISQANAMGAVSLQHESDDDSIELGRSGNSSPAASVSPLPNAVRVKDDEEVFRHEWRRLGVSNALNDIPVLRTDGSAPSSPNISSALRPVSPSSSPSKTDRQTQTPKSKRRKEIDKVNAAVHDYMDRIDDKLSKMYGIPPSSAIQRTAYSTTSRLIRPRYTAERVAACEVQSYSAATLRTPTERTHQGGKLSGVEENWESSSNCSSIRADEVLGQQQDADYYDT